MTALDRTVRRKLPCDAHACASAAEPVHRHEGGLGFQAPPGAYASLPAWRNAGAWLGAIKLHPRLDGACARRVRVPLFLTIMRELAEQADPATGRDIAVVHADIAAAIGCCTKTVQRACRIGYSLGVLHLVLGGCDMSINQRSQVLDRYGRGQAQRSWRKLPNFYAAVMPASLARLAVATPTPRRAPGAPGAVDVDKSPRFKIVCPPSRKVKVSGSSPFTLYGRKNFGRACGQLASPAQPDPVQTAAARPTTTRQRTGRRPGPKLEPELAAYAIALRARLVGFRGLSLARVGPALRRYRDGGLNPAALTAGLNTYLHARAIHWITDWDPRYREAQAKYLVGLLRDARLAGYLIPDPERQST